MIESRIKKSLTGIIWISLWFAAISEVSAADYEIINIENVFSNPSQAIPLQSRAIVIASSRQRFASLAENTRNALKGQFVYQAKVKVKGKIFFRLALGNFKSASDAKAALKKLKPLFPEAWIYQRSNLERQKLRANLKKTGRENMIEPVVKRTDSADNLLAKGKQAFLDGDYALVITIADRIVSTGNLEQLRAALELSGTARERQGKFSQAKRLYETLLDTSPPADISARVLSRLEGIRTMRMKPKARLADQLEKSAEVNWIFRGALQQYYREDVIDRSEEDSEEVNQAFVSDVDLQMWRKTDTDTLSIQIDAVLVNDLIEEQTDSRVSRATLSYARDEFRITGGRQHRTVKGVYGRFDGLTFSDLSRSEYQVSYFLGNLVQASYDSQDSDNPLIGANIDFRPYTWFDVNLYLIGQEISGLTDRQAIGSEFQLQNNLGFIYGIIDYDVFYEDWNNISFISNYRYNQQWTYNLTLGRANSPLLSTVNALQGQAVETIEELNEIYTEDEIYQLASDRTSKSNRLYFGVIYDFDNSRQINVDFSVFNLDATRTSGGVDEIPSSKNVLLSVDYSVKSFLATNDYTSIGVRLSDSDTNEIQSLRMRSRFPGPGGLVFDPRLQLDFRQNINSGVDQTILKPTIKLSYRATRNLNFETDLRIEYSDLDLPGFDKQVAYSFYLGYSYFF
jgi:hypothetical protein